MCAAATRRLIAVRFQELLGSAYAASRLETMEDFLGERLGGIRAAWQLDVRLIWCAINLCHQPRPALLCPAGTGAQTGGPTLHRTATPHPRQGTAAARALLHTTSTQPRHPALHRLPTPHPRQLGRPKQRPVLQRTATPYPRAGGVVSEGRSNVLRRLATPHPRTGAILSS